MADALDAVSPDVAGRTKALLSAVASGGTAGLKAYESAIADTTRAKTDGIARAQQRASLIGGPEAQGFEGQAAAQYDRGISNLGSSRASFESNMAQLGAAHKNYLDQVASSVPLVRADTQRQLALKKQALDAELAQSAAKAEKESKPKISEILNLAQNVGSLYADRPGDQPLKGVVGPNGRTETGSASINPNRNWVTDDLMMTAADNAAFNGTSVEFELAKIVAEVSGVDPNSTVAPSDVKPYLRAQPEATPDEKWITSNVRGVDPAKAKSILSDPAFVQAGSTSTDFAQAELDDKGKITEDGDYKGLTPREAFRKYVYAVVNDRPLADAAFEYYGANLRG